MQRHGGIDLRLLFRKGDGGFGVFEIAADVHDGAEGECSRQYLVIIVGEGRIHDVAVGVHEIVHDAPQLMVAPDGISAFSTLSTSSALSSSVAAVRIIPWLRVPRIFFGARLAMMTSFLPMSAAGIVVEFADAADDGAFFAANVEGELQELVGFFDWLAIFNNGDAQIELAEIVKGDLVLELDAGAFFLLDSSLISMLFGRCEGRAARPW